MRIDYFIFKRLADGKSDSIASFIIKMSIAATALSIAVMLMSTALIDGFQSEVQEKVFDFWAHIHIKPYTLTQSYNEHPMRLSETDKKVLEQTAGVKHFQSIVYKGALIKTEDCVEGVVLRGVGKDFNVDAIRNFIKKGRMLHIHRDSANPVNEIVISQATADKLNLSLNQSILLSFMDEEVRLRKFKICGIFKTGIESFDKQFALTEQAVIQKLNHWSADSVNGIEVYIDAPEHLDRIAESLKSTITDPNVEVLTMKEVRPDIFDWLQLQKTNEAIILAMMILVAIINLSTGILILILERTNMIGVLKALGMNNQTLGKIFLWQAFYIALRGILWGLAISLLLCFIQSQWHVVTLDEESYYLAYAPILIKMWKLLAIVVGTLLLSTAMMILPAWYVTKISPVKVIEFK